MLIALGFEFVNGFHDTANAVATVIYTHSLEPNIAVVWSGLCNLAGVLASSGTVAFAVITLLPVELILQVSSGAALPWSLPCSSRPFCGISAPGGSACRLQVRTPWWLHHRRRYRQPTAQHRSGTSGVDWEQALKVLKVLLISPMLASLPPRC